MAGRVIDPSRAPVAYGRRAVPQLFEELQRPEVDWRNRALTSLCDLLHDPELIYQTVNGGFLDQLRVLFADEDPSVRSKTCELLRIVASHSIGRQATLSSSLLPPLAQLLDDSSSSCRRNVLRVLSSLSQLPAGSHALLTLVPKLMQKLMEEEEEEEEEVQVLLLSTISSCSRMDPLSTLAADGVSLLSQKLSHRSPDVRREAAAAMMAISICEDGKRQVCAEAVLPVLVALLQDEDIEVQVNAAGGIMYTVTTTPGKQQCLDLDIIPILLDLVSKEKEEEEESVEKKRRRKARTVYCLRALTALAEAPNGRRALLKQLPILAARTEAAEEDQDIRRAAQTAVQVITWTP
ncbi:radial spoke head 14 homolog [Brachionichthys hirsutus]|uniref:radial spoke head 14 homolog n=1 Tax=Brachionichthys hirsutus TaxID=412623 RepID=UPI0036045F27